MSEGATVTIEQAVSIVRNHIGVQGLIALPSRVDGGCTVVPIGTPNKKNQVGSVTIFPSITAKTAAEAEEELKASVLEACRALVAEGALKSDAR